MILDTIAQASRKRAEKEMQIIPFEKMKKLALSMEIKNDFPFEQSLSKNGMSFICEIKKASPSKGIIAEDFPYLKIAKEYEEAKASAISVLTEPEFFMGSNDYLKSIAQAVSIPILRKDFIVDEYQIYQAKTIGADAVLLICALLDTQTIKNYIRICDTLGLSALVEAHTEEEIKSAINAGARIIGVNNRNLKTFEVDINNCIRLKKLVPENIIFVAESGIKTADDIKKLKDVQADAVLIGETFMRSKNKKETLEKLNGGAL